MNACGDFEYLENNSDRSACFVGLDVGQLVKDGWFTLFESIGAVEVMITTVPISSIRITG